MGLGSRRVVGLALVIACGWMGAARAEESGPRVILLRVPDGGIQPQAVVDPAGAIHLVYLAGDPAAADVMWTRAEPGAERFATPVRVNSEPGSAVALGTIRGAQLALGAGGRVHVIWNGSKDARPRNPIQGAPLLYSRSDEAGGFEPQRNLMRRTFGLDGGATVAADDSGLVVVAWHGRAPGDPDGEVGRRPWVARSTDSGATFAPESPALGRGEPTGACACCGTRALLARGTFFFMYRAATEGVHRDMLLLTDREGAPGSAPRTLEPWTLNACPMTLPAMVEAGPGVLAAWETQGQVAFARLDPTTGAPGPIVAAPGPAGGRKHPTIAGDGRGHVLLAWAEGTAWQKGGTLAYQLFNPDGTPLGPTRRIEGGIPTWSLPAAVARPDGSFVLIH